MILEALTFTEREEKTPLWLSELRKLRITLLTRPIKTRKKGATKKPRKTKLEKLLSLMTPEQRRSFETGKA